MVGTAMLSTEKSTASMNWAPSRRTRISRCRDVIRPSTGVSRALLRELSWVIAFLSSVGLIETTARGTPAGGSRLHRRALLRGAEVEGDVVDQVGGADPAGDGEDGGTGVGV